MYYKTYHNYLYCYQNLLQTPLQTQPPYRAHTERPRRAHGAIKDPTALPQLPHSATALQTQSCDVVLNMFKMIAAASHSKRWHLGHLPFWDAVGAL